METACYGRTDEDPKCLVEIPTNDGVVNETEARKRFKFSPGPLPLIPYRENVKPTPGPGKRVMPDLAWYDDEVVLQWEEEDEPPPPVPYRVTGRQMKLWLRSNYRTGKSLLELTYAALNLGPDGEAKDLRLIEFDHAIYFERDNPLTLAIISALGLSEPEANKAFVEAEKL